MSLLPRTLTFAQAVACAIALGFFGPEVSGQSLKGRIVGHVAPDDVTVVQARGLAFLDNGDVAEVLATETLDHRGGKGTYRGYEVLTFEDGSTVVSQFEGRDTLSEDGRYGLFEGTFRYTSGSGRFAGIEGGGTHSGRNYVASGAGFFVDFDGTYSLSHK